MRRVEPIFQKIMVPLDGSQQGESILPEVVELARALRAEVVLLRVLRVHAFADLNPICYLAGEETQLLQEAEGYLGAVAERLAQDGITVKTAVCWGEPAAEIVRLGSKEGAGLVAMSTHARSGLSRLVRGSVAEDVLRHTQLPVLLLRAERLN